MQQQARLERYVTTEAQLRGAIREVALRFNADRRDATFGARIVIAAAMMLRALITIPAQCVGLTIDGGRNRLSALTALDSVFVVHASHVTIENVITPAAGAEIDAVVAIGTTCSYFRLLHCTSAANRLFVETAAAFTNDAIIMGNIMEADVATRADTIMQIHGNRPGIIGNNCSESLGGFITVGAGGLKARVVGNEAGDGAIVTTASDGSNVVDGNTGCGTLTTHATDAVGLNT